MWQVKQQTSLIVGVALTAVLALVVGTATLAPVPAIGLGSDKLQHLLAFAALAVPLPFANPRLFLPVLLAAMTYGGLIEVVQPFVGRTAEWQDFGANVIGAILGAGLGSTIGLGINRPRNDDDPVAPKLSKASG